MYNSHLYFDIDVHNLAPLTVLFDVYIRSVTLDYVPMVEEKYSGVDLV